MRTSGSINVVMPGAFHETIPNRRPGLRQLLELLASEEKQRAYEVSLDVDVTAELFSRWYDVYGFGDRLFEACFTQDELIALARFSAFYQARRRLLPKSFGTVATLLASSVWRDIMLEASVILEKIPACP